RSVNAGAHIFPADFVTTGNCGRCRRRACCASRRLRIQMLPHQRVKTAAKTAAAQARHSEGCQEPYAASPQPMPMRNPMIEPRIISAFMQHLPKVLAGGLPVMGKGPATFKALV